MNYIIQWTGYDGELDGHTHGAEYLQSLIPSRIYPAKWGPKRTAKRWKTRRGAERATEFWQNPEDRPMTVVEVKGR